MLFLSAFLYLIVGIGSIVREYRPSQIEESSNFYDLDSLRSIAICNGKAGYHSNLLQQSFDKICSALKRTFLPVGYPHSVRSEYLRYQCWDSLQALCSYLRSVLTMQSVLTGVGVGSAEASTLAATISWFLKDGVGMIGSLLFAYVCSDLFEVNVKDWRLTADVLCNIALIFDMLVSIFPEHFLLLACISSVCKSCCGLVAGATRARISAHFAHRGHLADVTAKESTQETAITLIGLALGLICTNFFDIGKDPASAWTLFFVLMVIHQLANYQLVRALILDTFNPQRIYLLVQYSCSFEHSSDSHSTAFRSKHEEDYNSLSSAQLPRLLSPAEIARRESIFTPFWLERRGPVLGASLQKLRAALLMVAPACNSGEAELWSQLRNAWKTECFVIGLLVFLFCFFTLCVLV